MRQVHRTAAALLALGLVAGSTAGAQNPTPTPTPRMGLTPGTPAPDFRVQSLVGTLAPLQYADGAPTVLLFFLSSCPHCKHLIPLWNRAYEKRGSGVKVVGVMLDREPPGFFQLVPISFPVVHGADPREIGRLFRIAMVPMTVRVGPNRVIESVDVGDVGEAKLAEIFGK